MPEQTSITPTGTRYVAAGLNAILSEPARIQFQIRVELAYLREMLGFAGEDIAHLEGLNVADVVKELGRIGPSYDHETVALVQAIKKRLPPRTSRWVHAGLTASDIVDTADSLRYKEALNQAIIPLSVAFGQRLLAFASQYRDTLQIGRTHGKHAEPITLGLFFASHADRWLRAVQSMERSAAQLCGKFSGSVGSYGALSELVIDPVELETRVLQKLGLQRPVAATQRVPPEPLLHVLHHVVVAWGVLANMADDLRNLARTEIGEVEWPEWPAGPTSSSMPHKRNPWPVERVKATWKEFAPRIVTRYLNQISEHQRDLTDSLSSRYVAEMLYMFHYAVAEMNRSLDSMEVNSSKLSSNMSIAWPDILSQPKRLAKENLGSWKGKTDLEILEAYRSAASLQTVRILEFWNRQLPRLIPRQD